MLPAKGSVCQLQWLVSSKHLGTGRSQTKRARCKAGPWGLEKGKNGTCRLQLLVTHGGALVHTHHDKAVAHAFAATVPLVQQRGCGGRPS